MRQGSLRADGSTETIGNTKLCLCNVRLRLRNDKEHAHWPSRYRPASKQTISPSINRFISHHSSRLDGQHSEIAEQQPVAATIIKVVNEQISLQFHQLQRGYPSDYIILQYLWFRLKSLQALQRFQITSLLVVELFLVNFWKEGRAVSTRSNISLSQLHYSPQFTLL